MNIDPTFGDLLKPAARDIEAADSTVGRRKVLITHDEPKTHLVTTLTKGCTI